MRTVLSGRQDEGGYIWYPVLPEHFRDEQERARYDSRSATHNVPGFTNVFKHGLGGLEIGRASCRERV